MGAKLTTKEVAQILGTPVNTLHKWRSKDKGPRYIQYEGYVRYDEDDIEAFIEACTVTPAGLDTGNDE